MRFRLQSLCNFCLFFLLQWQSSVAQIKPLEKIPDDAQKAYIGFYLMNIHDLDMVRNSFYADFYLWARWKGELNPFDGLEFVNGVDDWGTTQEDLVDSVVVDSQGYNYFIRRIEGRFYHSFELARYPLDQQKIAIQIENAWEETGKLVLLPDTANSKYREDMQLSGWKILKTEMTALENSYGTNFGDIAVPKDSKYSNLAFSMTLGRSSNYFFWKLLLPLMIVLFSSIGAFFLHPKYVEARISLPLSGLLTAVFLQESYSNNLPDISYMVLMDQIYVLSYLLIVIAIIETIVTAHLVNNKRRQSISRIRRLDMLFFKGQIVALVVGILVLILLQ